MRIVHITDLHIHGKASKNRNVERKLDYLNSRMNEDDILVVSGDIVDDGYARQYGRACELFEPWIGRIVLASGNHDLGPFGNSYNGYAARRWKQFRKAMGSTDHFGNIRFKALGSYKRVSALGEVGWYQRTLVKKFAKKYPSPDYVTVVVLHHDPWIDKPFLRLTDRKEFMETVKGRVDYVLCGHEHRRKDEEYREKRKSTRIISADDFVGCNLDDCFIDVGCGAILRR